MPQISYTRFWCSKCQEYTLQKTDGPCLTCGTETKTYKLSDVPEDKILAQRKRYRQSRRDKVLGVYGRLLGASHDTFFDEVGSNVVIHETDAGQDKIDEIREEAKLKRAEEKDLLVKEYNSIYKNTGRNDVCPCLSGKKYKKCCMSKFDNIL